MAKASLLAFLLCDNATKNGKGKVTLHGLFDRIIIPRTPAPDKLFFAYYKIVAAGAYTISMRITHSSGKEVKGDWRDSFSHLGSAQSVWALVSSLFREPGHYTLELRQELDGSESLLLASILFVVDQEGV